MVESRPARALPRREPRGRGAVVPPGLRRRSRRRRRSASAAPPQLVDPAALPASCRPNRGPEGAPVFLLNHWITTDPVPLPSNAAQVNAYEPLLRRARECQRIRDAFPNLIAVDFYREGDVFRVVDTLNGVGVTSLAQRLDWLAARIAELRSWRVPRVGRPRRTGASTARRSRSGRRGRTAHGVHRFEHPEVAAVGGRAAAARPRRRGARDAALRRRRERRVRLDPEHREFPLRGRAFVVERRDRRAAAVRHAQPRRAAGAARAIARPTSRSSACCAGSGSCSRRARRSATTTPCRR